jgi:hypothetical protein
MKSEEIRELLEAAGPCVTIVAPKGDLPAALASVRDELRTKNEDLADGLDDEIARAIGEANGRGQVAVLSAPGIARAFVADSALKPVSKVGDRFDVRTLVSARSKELTFFLLALSQRRTRILECTRYSSREIPFGAETPTSLEDAMQTRKPDHDLDNNSTGGPSTGSMRGVMFGTTTDREDKDEYMLHFFSAIDKAVTSLLKGRNEPLVVAGVEHELALYKSVNTYKSSIEPGVHGAPDGMEGGEMHRRALELIDSRIAEDGVDELTDFDKKVGTGHASMHVQEIVAAAYEGRISHLYFREDASYSGTYDPIRRRVKHTSDPLDNPIDLVESAAFETIRHGGEARILPASAMPNGVPVCAVFRYAPQTRAEAPEAA